MLEIQTQRTHKKQKEIVEFLYGSRPDNGSLVG